MQNIIRQKHFLHSISRKYSKLCTKSAAQNRNSENIRNTFIEFFKSNYSHEFIRSSSVVPFCDPTVPFVNAGMNQVCVLDIFNNFASSFTILVLFDSLKTFSLVWPMHHVQLLSIHRNAFVSVASTTTWTWLVPMAITIRFLKCLAIGRLEIISSKKHAQWHGNC